MVGRSEGRYQSEGTVGGRKGTTVLNGGVYRQTSTLHKSGNKMKMMPCISTHGILKGLPYVDVHIEDCLRVLHDVTETTLTRLRRLVKSRLKTQDLIKHNF